MADDDRDRLDQLEIIPRTAPHPQWARKPKGGYQPRSPRVTREPLERTVDDYMDILGVPRKEMTPAVQQALARLSDEIDHERREAELAREHAHQLEGMVETHSFLPLMNRRAFLNELASAITHVERTGTSSSLALFHVRSAETVRRHFGRRALDSLLLRVAETLMDSLRGTDVGGGLGGNDFGVILALAPEEGATGKVHRIKNDLEALRPTWRGRPVPVEIGVGVRTIVAGDTPDMILDEADRDLLVEEEADHGRETRLPWETSRR